MRGKWRRVENKKQYLDARNNLEIFIYIPDIPLYNKTPEIFIYLFIYLFIYFFRP